MYNAYRAYPSPYFVNIYNPYGLYPYPYWVNTPMYNSNFHNQFSNQYIPFMNATEYNSNSDFMQLTRSNGLIPLKDYGPKPFVIDINEATKRNDNYRTTLWTGDHLQLTLMSINPGEDIGLEIHPHLDQFIRIEEGEGIVKMGNSKCNLDFQRKVYDDFAIIIPAGTWHNLINTTDTPLKLYSIYAPPQHPYGTVHETKAIAQAAEENHGH